MLLTEGKLKERNRNILRIVNNRNKVSLSRIKTKVQFMYGNLGGHFLKIYKITQKYLIFGSKFGYRGHILMEEIPQTIMKCVFGQLTYWPFWVWVSVDIDVNQNSGFNHTLPLEVPHTCQIDFQTAKKIPASNLAFHAFEGFIGT